MNYWFSALSLTLAVSYTVLAFNMGPKDSHIANLIWMGIFYIPLFINSFRTLKYSKEIVIKLSSWLYLFLLIISTIAMIHFGQNMAGAILGSLNLILCYVMLSHISTAKKYLTDRSSGTPNGSL